MTPAAASTSGLTARSAAPTGDPWAIRTMAPAATARPSSTHNRASASTATGACSPDDLFRQDHVLERGPGGTPGLEGEAAVGMTAVAAPTSAGAVRDLAGGFGRCWAYALAYRSSLRCSDG